MFSVVFIASTSACRVPEDAIAASQQMTATSPALDKYYETVDAAVGDTIALLELDAARSGIAYTDVTRKQQEDSRAELQKRREMAEELAQLSAFMEGPVNTTASSNVGDAATKLGNELVAIKALPNGSPVPDAVGKAGKFLIQIIQQHEEQKAARAMDETLRAVGLRPLSARQWHPSRRLERDWSAVDAALRLPWSNGIIEGQIHQLKLTSD